MNNHQPEIDRALLAQQQTSRVDELRQAKYENILESNPALSLVKGYTKFKNANTLIVNKMDVVELEIVADRILIATGSTPHDSSH